MTIHHHTPAEMLTILPPYIEAHEPRPTRVLSDDEIAEERWLETRAEDERHVSPSEGDYAAGVYEESLGRWTA